MLASLFQKHEIHFGYRGGVPFMRARSSDKVLEYIPAPLFLPKRDGVAPDLPLPLIHGFVHWLDLNSRTLEIRPVATMWWSRYSDWKIDLGTNQGWRNRVLLVDPQSNIFGRVASIIEPFEHRDGMVVFQPQKGSLVLDLPSLELSFRVNSNGMLESRQLGASIDQDQDSGTLYGISSSLVLRDVKVPDDRSILVAMGPATIQKEGHHVKIKIRHSGYYARFFINKTLGRLECASDPRLTYFKAYCHSITSSVMPDPLTGRTGTEEAMHCLEAGNA